MTPDEEVQELKAPTASDKLLSAIIDQGKILKGDTTPATRTKAETLLTEFISQFANNDEAMEKGKADTFELIKRQIARLDEQLSQKVDAILHDAEFQRLEASWRGLHYLVMNTETSSRLKLRLLCVDRDTLAKDLSQAADVDQSTLFKKVYEEEYGTYGGNPFSLLIADYYFGRLPADIEFLKNLSKVASAAHTPLISAADSKLFGWDSFTELSNPRDLSKIFESSELAAWRSFRESEDARYVTLTLPRFLLRLPYGDKTVKVEAFSMNEDVSVAPHTDPIPVLAGDTQKPDRFKLPYGNGDEPHGELVLAVKEGSDAKAIDALKLRIKEQLPKKHTSYLWGNAAYALGQRITNAFALYGWCAAIRGPEGGGLVRDLPNHTFETEEGDIAAKCPTEIAITDRRENELNSLGFVALCHRKGENYAAFFGGQTIHKPQLYSTDAANSNALISARLPYLLAASRFAHYLKVMCRDKIGSFQSKGTISEYLNRWIMGYVLGTDDAGQELKAQYPLREARVDVFDVPGKPGAYRAVVFLRPHFQLEELTASIRLVAELPPPVAA
jgi:type VI secretion system protein ImpC